MKSILQIAVCAFRNFFDFVGKILHFLLFFAPSLIRLIAYSANLRVFGQIRRLFGAIVAYSVDSSCIRRLNTP